MPKLHLNTEEPNKCCIISKILNCWRTDNIMLDPLYLTECLHLKFLKLVKSFSKNFKTQLEKPRSVKT